MWFTRIKTEKERNIYIWEHSENNSCKMFTKMLIFDWHCFYIGCLLYFNFFIHQTVTVTVTNCYLVCGIFLTFKRWKKNKIRLYKNLMIFSMCFFFWRNWDTVLHFYDFIRQYNGVFLFQFFITLLLIQEESERLYHFLVFDVSYTKIQVQPGRVELDLLWRQM